MCRLQLKGTLLHAFLDKNPLLKSFLLTEQKKYWINVICGRERDIEFHTLF
jgi:hypothetical protein